MIAQEAIGRFFEPVPVKGMTMMIVAGIGVVINSVTAMLFSSGHKHDLNIKGAYLHMAADAGVSLGVVVAGLAIMATGWEWLDPAISLTIVAIILIGTLKLFRESANLSLDAVPQEIDTVKVRRYLQNLPGVSEVHDLHIWATSTTENALTVHLTMPQATIDDAFLCAVSNALYEKFNIDHPTIQIEQGDIEYACRQSVKKAAYEKQTKQAEKAGS
jgi:cobalt-zinc-cadmium efflux system protein